MDDSYHIYGVGVRGGGGGSGGGGGGGGSGGGGGGGGTTAPRVSTLRRDFTDATQPFDATRYLFLCFCFFSFTLSSLFPSPTPFTVFSLPGSFV